MMRAIRLKTKEYISHVSKKCDDGNKSFLVGAIVMLAIFYAVNTCDEVTARDAEAQTVKEIYEFLTK